MSEFSRLTEEEEAGAEMLRRGPSPLQIAWALVIVVFGGILIWLSLGTEPGRMETDDVSAEAAGDIERPDGDKLLAPQDETETPPGTKSDPGTPEPAKLAQAEPAVGAQSLARPDTSLQEDGKYGPLPVISGDRQPWQTYSHAFEDPENRPRIAIIINGLGLGTVTTTLAMERLPSEVTLGLSPYGRNLPDWAEKARVAGHETLVVVPMEPQSYPSDDPGPQTLLTSLTRGENLDRLHWSLSRFQGYVGIVNDMGSKFTASDENMRYVLDDLKKRGILLLDARSSRYTKAAKLAREANIPWAINSRFIDNDLTPEEIDRQLAQLETVARGFGTAVGIGHAYPVSIERVAAWARGMHERGFVLAPITAIANRQLIN